MYNNPYFNQTPSIERINGQIQELEKMRNQMQQSSVQPSINQTFQLAPTNSSIKYANTIEDVQKELVFSDTAFFSNDMKVVWIKNTKGEIKSYELVEIIQKDEKDYLIDSLMLEIKKLKEEKDEQSNIINDVEPIEIKKSTTSTRDRKTHK